MRRKLNLNFDPIGFFLDLPRSLGFILTDQCIVPIFNANNQLIVIIRDTKLGYIEPCYTNRYFYTN